jgi:CRISPR-associated protein Cas1
MGILYITEQGATLVKDGNRLLVEKQGKVIRWAHAFKLDQVVLMGNVSISSPAIAYLLQEGIDTVFLSYHGKYRGRLVSQFGKNVELRRMQFRRLEDPDFRLTRARAYVRGKLDNCRVLLRSQNRGVMNESVTAAVHRLRVLARRTEKAETVEGLMGMEGTGAATHFGCFQHLIRVDDIRFDGRNRRPPKDPVNVLLSLGYTLLANAIQTQTHIVGLDPGVGCLHGIEYGRPSLVLDLMEEFRPVIVDSLVLKVINKRIIRATDFYRPEDREPAAFDFAEEESVKEGFPILLRHEGMKKFIAQFEERLNQQVLYVPQGRRLTYRGVFLEQVRLFARTLAGEAEYVPFAMR